MKKIFLFLAVASALVACDPVEESISNDGNITQQQLIDMTSVSVDKADNGQNGNLVSCTTSAPVNAKWTIAGKDFIGNFASKKLKLGQTDITLTALCADGTVLTADFSVNADVITHELQRFYIYGEPGSGERPFKPAGWDAAAMRFSENEGKFTDIDGKEGCCLPYLSDDIYWGKKTLIFDITDCTADINAKIMTGWWSPVFYEDFNVYNAIGAADGLWELPLTEDIAKACARGNGGDGRDLDIMLKSGSCTVNAIYYEE